MSMVNGTTKVQNLGLELLALESEAHGATGMILAQADEAEREDLANDPVLVQALKDVERAIELDEGTDRQASLIQAKMHLQQAISMDLAEMAVVRLRAYIMPFHAKFEVLMNESRKVIGDLCAVKLARRAA